MPPSCAVSLRVVLAVRMSSWIVTFFSSSLKNDIGILMGIALWLDCFWPYGHFTVLILSVKENGSPVCCWGCCLGFLFHCIKAFVVEVFHLVRFIPRYFILGWAVMNEIFFLISFSVSLLFVYLKAADFYTLILRSATLLKVFILTVFVGSFNRITSSTNRDSLIYSLCIFLFLVAIVKVWGTSLSKRGKWASLFLVSKEIFLFSSIQYSIGHWLVV